MKIMRLTKKMALENINRLIEIDKVVLDETWREDNFLMGLDGKWEHSLIALEDTNIVGFVVCSMKGKNLHIHRLAVSAEFQKRGIGTSLMVHLFGNCDKKGINYITVKTKRYNINAQRFYETHDFKRIETDDPDYIYRKVIK